VKVSLVSGQSGNEVCVDWNLRETQKEFRRTDSGNEFPAYAIGTVHPNIQLPKSGIQFIGVWVVYRRIVISGQGFRVLLRRQQPNG